MACLPVMFGIEGECSSVLSNLEAFVVQDMHDS